MKPKVFIASSSESLTIANAVADYFKQYAEVVVWNSGVFIPSSVTIESLFRQVKLSDFAICVMYPEDKLIKREKEAPSARDNILFELGLFTGSLGRDRCFGIRPKGAEMHIPTDLLGVCIPSYTIHTSGDDHETVDVRDACDQLWRAMRESLEASPLWLARFVTREEPRLIDRRHASLSVGLAYKLLLYMFRNEEFTNFSALDLAFHRWEEILGLTISPGLSDTPPVGQAVNISSEILDNCDSLFKRGGCKSFRRILVIDHMELQQEKSKYILRKFLEVEGDWKKRFPGVSIETRVIVWDKVRNPNVREQIAHLHDIAIFESEYQNIAIIEPTLTAPTDRPAVPSCSLNTKSDEIIRMRESFDRLWEVDSRSIEDVLKQNQKRKIVTPNNPQPSPPALQARHTFQQHMLDIRSPCVAIIEAGYFEERAPNDPERITHIWDAVWLRDELRMLLPRVNDRVIMESFINDLSRPECGYDCSDVSASEIKIATKTGWQERLRKILGTDLPEDEWEVFLMKETRARLLKMLRKKLKVENGTVFIDDIEYPDQIQARTRHSNIIIGHRTDGKGGLAARCAGLMAQHYFDLITKAATLVPDLQEIWIFDFNRSSEALAVKQGAMVAFSLFPFKEGLRLRIVNAIYQPLTSGEPTIYTHLMP